MNILFLSDLHFLTNEFNSKIKIGKLKNRFEVFNIPIQKADVICIAGDIFESSIMNTDLNPFEILSQLFDRKPVVFCLGNHEFAYQDYQDVIQYWNKKQTEALKNNFGIFCLDVLGNIEIEDYNFIGNVFWYDWSLNNCRILMKGEIIDGWLDSTIKNFDPMKENLKCQKQILDRISNKNKNILITHMVPHESLNWFSKNDPYSPFNAYSGMKNFLKELEGKNVIYALCGHTHKRMSGVTYGINCLNLGNDYFFKSNNISWFLIEN